jgi:Bacterial Ig-like domain (group 3)/Abnormal spindle-like microcephaly-assoc'd, ASPM-SPD-2-Hydin/HYDIN/CFA65/VesB-like, Ig-like domain/Cep192 domain 4
MAAGLHVALAVESSFQQPAASLHFPRRLPENNADRCFSIRMMLAIRRIAFLWIVLSIHCAQAALGGSITQNGITITQNFSSVYYVDTKTSPFPTGYYAVYNITNNTGSAFQDIWVTLGNFTGTTVYLSLAGNDTGVSHLGTLAAGASKAAYFFLGVNCSSFASGNCNISASQGFTVDVYLGPPTGNLLAALTTNDITVYETIAANANKVNSGSVSTTTPSVGSTFTVTVNGSTGTIGGSNIFALSPETSTSFPANSFELTNTSLTFSNGGSGTYTDLLQIPTSVISGISSANYTVTYSYRVTGTTSATTTVQPIAYINSGSQIKHTSISSLANIPAIQAAGNTLLLSMTVSPTSLTLSGGTVTYTVNVTNSGSTAVSLDEFVDVLASSPGTENYVASSSTFAGSAVTDPTISGSTLTWAGNFSVPANGSANLSFQTTIPGTAGTYDDHSYGLVSASQIDTTASTSDSAPATTSVTVSSKQSITISISNIPASAAYGGSFTPTYGYTGDGTASVSSNTTSVCTVTNGVVHYVGVGTCSLTASATAGTNYNAVTGTAQTFSVGQATPTISISNLPASGAYGGSFTPTFSYAGDGATSVSSNTSSICTVTSGVVHYVGVGTCSLAASAIAGTNYASVTGTAQTFSVGQATPTISISNLPASGAYGGSFTPTFSYAGDGTASVSSNTTSICTVTSGVVHYVGVGTCSLMASATAGTNYASVTGAAQTFSVGQATPTISISNLPASGAYGGSFTPTFSYVGDGTASVSSNTTSICTVTSGVVHYVGVGTCSLTASATAGTNYASVTGTAQTFSVGQANPTISISNLPASGAYGGSFTPTFSYAGDGTTSVSSNTTSICTVTSGVVHYVGVGTCSLTASATAGSHYASVTGTAQTFAIGQATPTISISNLPANGTNGGSFTPTFNYSGDGTTSVGSNTTSVCTVTSGVVHYIGVGTCSLTASATAGTNYAAVTGTAQSFSVGQASATISISNLPASGTYGGSFTPTFSYSGDGTTSVGSNTTSVCTVTSGVVHYVGVGTCSLTASATAGANSAAVTGTAQTFSVGQATPTISISNLPASGTYGGRFTPTFSYSGDGTTSVGSNTTSVCTVTSGVVHYTGVGTCSLTASATAGTNYAAITGTAQTFSVGQASPTISISNLPASGAYGGSFTPTFNYTGDGTASVISNTPSVCTVTSGVVHFVGVGTCSLTASATAGTNSAAVTGTAQTFSVGQASPTISISNLPASGTYGGSFTPTFSYTGDGTTTVTSNTPSVCTVTSGVVHFVGVGTCSLTASATAGTNSAAVTGTAQTFSVGQASATISISNLPASGTYGGSFTPTFNYTGDGTTSVTSNTPSVCTLTSGVVHFVGVGTCSLTASATAGTNSAAVTGTAQTFAVGQSVATVTLSNLNLTYSGSPQSGAVTTSPSGLSVTVTYNGSTVTPTAAGSYTMVANISEPGYSGSATGTLVIARAAQAIDFSALPAQVTYGVGAITLSAAGGASRNAVTFSILSGPGNVNGNQLAITGVGTIVVAANQAGNSNYFAAQQATQNVTVVSAGLSLNPSALAFLSQPVGTTSAAQTLIVTNPSSLPVTVTSIQASGDFNVASACQIIAPQANCSINVTFTPTASGPRTGTLTITTAQPNGAQTVSLSGPGIGALILISPAALGFGSQVVSTTSVGQTLTIQNNGTAALAISNATTTGDFAASGNCAIVPAGSNCSLTVSFTPSAIGNRTGILTLTDNAGGQSQTVTLSGTGTIPSAVLTPGAQAFPATLVGSTSQPLTATLTNTGTTTLAGISVSTAGNFTETSDCPAALSPAMSCTLNVVYAPTIAGAESGMLTVNDSAGSQTIALTGAGFTAGATLNTAQLIFGGQLVGTPSLAQTVTFTNNGTVPVTINTVTATSNFTNTTNCPGQIAPAASCSVNVVFTPTTIGSLTGTITIAGSAGSQVVNLQGQGVGPGAAITPSFALFGSQLVNTVSLAQTLTAKNTGSVPLNLKPITVSNNFLESDQCPAVLPIGGSCLISVSFAPSATGTLYGSLQFSDTLGQVQTVVTLTGQGTLPGIATTPSTVFFGSVPVGMASLAQTVTVWNAGSAPLQIQSIKATGDFSETDTCGASSLPVGGNCVINVVLTPTTMGTRTGEIQIADNADGVHLISLSGVGQLVGVTVLPTSLAFGSLPYVPPSQASQIAGTVLNVTLTNTANTPLQLISLKTEGDFSESDNCGSTVPVGGSCTLNVRFVPTALGHRTGILTITDNAGGGVQQVTLAGDGSPYGLILTPPVISFGVQTVGTKSSSQTATLTNNTGQALTDLVITPSGEFSEAGNCGASLGNGSLCTLNITVTPTSTGALTGTVTISSGLGISATGAISRRPIAHANTSETSSSTVGVVALTASAIPPGIQLSVPQLLFSLTSVGTPSTGQTVTLTNSGTALPLTNLSISETNAAEFPFISNCPAILPPQASCVITVKFVPNNYGLSTGIMNITADGGIAVALPESGTASKGTPVVTLASNVNRTMLQSAITFMTTVTAGASTPTGSVTFMDGSTNLGTVALTNGAASLSSSALAAGTHNVSVVYGGDADYAAASSSPVSETVLDFLLKTVGTSSQTVAPGSVAAYQVAVTPSDGTSFPVLAVLSIVGLPQGATTTLNPTSWTQLTATSFQIPANTTLEPIALTFHVPGQIVTAEMRGSGYGVRAVVCGLFLLPFAYTLRRARYKLHGYVAAILLAAGMVTVAGLSGCGSRNGFFGQESQTYDLTVTVTAGAVSHSVDLTLKVQ